MTPDRKRKADLAKRRVGGWDIANHSHQYVQQILNHFWWKWRNFMCCISELGLLPVALKYTETQLFILRLVKIWWLRLVKIWWLRSRMQINTNVFIPTCTKCDVQGTVAYSTLGIRVWRWLGLGDWPWRCPLGGRLAAMESGTDCPFFPVPTTAVWSKPPSRLLDYWGTSS